MDLTIFWSECACTRVHMPGHKHVRRQACKCVSLRLLAVHTWVPAPASLLVRHMKLTASAACASDACAALVPGVELRHALEEWQDRRLSGENSPSRLSTGFLDGTHPVVDIYELKVGRPISAFCRDTNAQSESFAGSPWHSYILCVLQMLLSIPVC